MIFFVNGVLFRKDKFLMSLNFNGVHVPRSCNRGAHDLAHVGLNWDLDRSHVWIDPLPEFVTTLGARDVNEPPQN